MDSEIIDAIRDFIRDWKSVRSDIYAIKNMYDDWRNDKQFIEFEHHIDVTVVSSAPSAGDLNQDEIQFGDGTGPNGRDEIFWSVDGSTVARVEADSEIT